MHAMKRIPFPFAVWGFTDHFTSSTREWRMFPNILYICNFTQLKTKQQYTSTLYLEVWKCKWTSGIKRKKTSASSSHTNTFRRLLLIKASVMWADTEDEWWHYHCHVYWLLHTLSRNVKHQFCDVNKSSLHLAKRDMTQSVKNNVFWSM